MAQQYFYSLRLTVFLSFVFSPGIHIKKNLPPLFAFPKNVNSSVILFYYCCEVKAHSIL